LKKYIIFISFIGLVFFFFQCSKPLISSKYGDISQGTFDYIKYVFYSKEKDIRKVIRKIKKEEAIGYLAEQYKLREDKSFEHFHLLTIRTRHKKTAVMSWRHSFKKDFSKEDIYRKYGCLIDFKKKAKEIYSITHKKGKIEYDDILICNSLKGRLTFKELRPLLLQHERKQLVSLAVIPLAGALQENLDRWLYKIETDKVLKQFKADIDAVNRYDFNRTADSFLLAKYGLAVEGVYPVKTFRINLKPDEIFDHFFRIKNQFQPVKEVLVEYCLLKNRKSAIKFEKEMKKFGVFYELAKEHTLNNKFIYTAKPHIIKGYNQNHPIIDKEKRPLIQQTILSLAQKDKKGFTISKLTSGYIAINIKKIDKFEKKIDFKVYRNFVKKDLIKMMLEKQYKVDIRFAEIELDFK